MLSPANSLVFFLSPRSSISHGEICGDCKGIHRPPSNPIIPSSFLPPSFTEPVRMELNLTSSHLLNSNQPRSQQSASQVWASFFLPRCRLSKLPINTLSAVEDLPGLSVFPWQAQMKKTSRLCWWVYLDRKCCVCGGGGEGCTRPNSSNNLLSKTSF